MSVSEGNVKLNDVDFAYEGEGGSCTSDVAFGSSSSDDALNSMLLSWKVDEVLTSCPATAEDEGNRGSKTDRDEETTSAKDGVG